jgi:hypothetical protein
MGVRKTTKRLSRCQGLADSEGNVSSDDEDAVDEHGNPVAMGAGVTVDAWYISFVILHTKYTKRRLNDSNVRG